MTTLNYFSCLHSCFPLLLTDIYFMIVYFVFIAFTLTVSYDCAMNEYVCDINILFYNYLSITNQVRLNK